MDLKTSKYLHPQPQGVGVRKDNPFDDSFVDDLFLPIAKKSSSSSNCNSINSNMVVEAPPTPGRPVFSFSVVGSRKNFPSKWDDAEKWVISESSPAHHHHHFLSKRQEENHHHHNHKTQQQQVSKAISVLQVPTTTVSMDHSNIPFSPSDDLLLKDKFTNVAEAEPTGVSRFKCLEGQHFLFTAMKDASTEVVEDVKRNVTPFKSLSPPRHNTPASMSGPLALNTSFDIADLQQQLHTPFDCNWSSREEEEDDVSKSLRHFEINNNIQCQKTIPPNYQPTTCAWEQEAEPTKSHPRYQREEAKIQAWVNLQKAKAEAQSRKLEVKIQKMRWKFEEKMMRRMASVDRKAEELRAAAQHEIQKASMQGKKSVSGHGGCFPCTTTLHP